LKGGRRGRGQEKKKMREIGTRKSKNMSQDRPNIPMCDQAKKKKKRGTKKVGGYTRTPREKPLGGNKDKHWFICHPFARKRAGVQNFLETGIGRGPNAPDGLILLVDARNKLFLGGRRREKTIKCHWKKMKTPALTTEPFANMRSNALLRWGFKLSTGGTGGRAKLYGGVFLKLRKPEHGQQ